jgi:hypothetical protein
VADGDREDAGWAGMATGSDAGAPGDHLPEPPLDEDEQALLAELERPAEGTPVDAVEDGPAMVQAAEDDSPLPAAGGDPDDPDTARFVRPI